MVVLSSSLIGRRLSGKSKIVGFVDLTSRVVHGGGLAMDLGSVNFVGAEESDFNWVDDMLRGRSGERVVNFYFGGFSSKKQINLTRKA